MHFKTQSLLSKLFVKYTGSENSLKIFHVEKLLHSAFPWLKATSMKTLRKFLSQSESREIRPGEARSERGKMKTSKTAGAMIYW